MPSKIKYPERGEDMQHKIWGDIITIIIFIF